jgi:hypothetical protein
MTRRTLGAAWAVGVVLAGAWAGAGCGGSSEPADADAATTDMGTDAPRPAMDAGADARPDVPQDVFFLPEVPTRDVVITPNHELVYVINAFTIDPYDADPAADLAAPHVGFNVDGLFSDASDPGGCGHADYHSRLDVDQNRTGAACTAAGCGGVDNQLPLVVDTVQGLGGPSDLRSYIQDQINQNRLVFVVRLTGVDDLVNDDSVGVYVYQGLPTFATMCGTVEPGREYQIARNSLRAGGTTIDDASVAGAARIVAGRLDFEAAGGSLPIVVPVDPSRDLTLQVHRIHIRMDVTMAAGARGNLGGFMQGDEVIAAVGTLAPVPLDLIEPTIGSLIDVRVGGVCFEGPRGRMHFGGVSVGAGISAVSARIHPTAPIADARMAGACGQ